MAQGANGGKARYLRPPFTWVSLKMGLQEDKSRPRWSPGIIRAMRNGTFDWKKETK